MEDFRGDVEGWVIDAIRGLGLDTAKAVLRASREMLVEKADLEEEMVDDLFSVLAMEFEDEEEFKKFLK